MCTEWLGSLEVFESSLAYRKTFPDSGQNNKKGKFMKVQGDQKCKG